MTTHMASDADALREYDRLLILDGVYGRRKLNDWEVKRFCELSQQALEKSGEGYARRT